MIPKLKSGHAKQIGPGSSDKIFYRFQNRPVKKINTISLGSDIHPGRTDGKMNFKQCKKHNQRINLIGQSQRTEAIKASADKKFSFRHGK